VIPEQPSHRIRNVLLFLVGFLAVIGVLTYFFGRPQVIRHRYLFAFREPPAPDGADATIALMRRRLAELAEPDWKPDVRRLPGGGIELTFTSDESPGDLVHWVTTPGRCSFHVLDVDRERVQAAVDGRPPEGWMILQFLESCDGFDESTGEPIRRLYPKLAATPPAMAVGRLGNASVRTEGIAKYVHFRLTFEPADVKRLGRLSEQHAGKPLGIVVDGILRVITRVGPTPDADLRSIEIVDLLDIPEMKKLAVVLRHGPLPCPVVLRRHERRRASDGTPVPVTGTSTRAAAGEPRTPK
jgi:preprotein translocase subunit SecD